MAVDKSSPIVVEEGSWAEFQVGDVGPGGTALGQFVRELRARRGQSMRGLSRATGVSQPYISMIEKGQVKGAPSLRILSALANHFGVPTESFLVVAGLSGAAESTAPRESLRDTFRELILHPALRPAELTERDLRWLSEDLQRVLLDYSVRLHRELVRDPEGEVAVLLGSLDAPQSEAP